MKEFGGKWMMELVVELKYCVLCKRFMLSRFFFFFVFALEKETHGMMIPYYAPAVT